MMTAFVLPDGMGLGGVTTWSIEMARQLAAAGQPTCLLEHVNPAAKREPVPQHVRLVQHHGRLPTRARPRDVYEYAPTYLEVLPGVIVPNYSFGTYAACAALARQRADSLRVLGFAHTDQTYYYLLLGYYEPLVQLFVAVSQEVSQVLAARLPHRRQDIRARPYGVAVAAALSRTYSPPDAPIQLVYAGRLVEYQKRVSDLINLAEILGQRQVNFCLRIIGDAGEEKNLVRDAQRLPLSARARVHFEKRVPYEQMPAVWRSADICVLVSECEGTSISMLEAMANGCVPVVTRVSGAPAAVTPGQNGYLVKVGDLAEMARIIQMLAAERDKLAQLGAASHRVILDNYSLPAYVKWFLDLVREVKARPPRPWPAARPLLPLWLRPYSLWMAASAPLWRLRRWPGRFMRQIMSTGR